jgi:hypothetical protein
MSVLLVDQAQCLAHVHTLGTPAAHERNRQRRLSGLGEVDMTALLSVYKSAVRLQHLPQIPEIDFGRVTAQSRDDALDARHLPLPI